MSFATTIFPPATAMPFLRMSLSAALIVAMSLCSAWNSSVPMAADGLRRKASIFSAIGRSLLDTSSFTVASASAVPCIASA